MTRWWPLAAVLATSCAAPEILRSVDSASPAPLARRAAATRAPEGEPPETVRLEFVDDFNPPRPGPPEALDAPGARWDAALGGLSGLYYDRPSATLYAVSDLPRRFEPRFYTFDVELTDTSLDISPKAVFSFHEREPSGALEDLDVESLTSDGRGAFYVGTENGFDRPNQPAPRILQMQADGLLTGALTLPEAVLPAGAGAPPRGTRSNLAFEGLALSPSGRWLSAIVESALYQDGADASFEAGAAVRLLRWDLSAGGEPAQYFYEVEPIPYPRRGTPVGGNNGVSALVNLDERRLLVLERSYVPLAEGPGPNTIRIFEIAIPSEPAPDDGAPRRLSKRLVLDLDEIVPKLEPHARSLDNIEGMTLGPDLPSGGQSLLLVSDDNFSATQRTFFLAFRVLRSPGAAPEREADLLGR